jgi:hypothetical protein
MRETYFKLIVAWLWHRSLKEFEKFEEFENDKKRDPLTIQAG